MFLATGYLQTSHKCRSHTRGLPTLTIEEWTISVNFKHSGRSTEEKTSGDTYLYDSIPYFKVPGFPNQGLEETGFG